MKAILEGEQLSANVLLGRKVMGSPMRRVKLKKLGFEGVLRVEVFWSGFWHSESYFGGLISQKYIDIFCSLLEEKYRP